MPPKDSAHVFLDLMDASVTSVSLDTLDFLLVDLVGVTRLARKRTCATTEVFVSVMRMASVLVRYAERIWCCPVIYNTNAEEQFDFHFI